MKIEAAWRRDRLAGHAVLAGDGDGDDGRYDVKFNATREGGALRMEKYRIGGEEKEIS